MSIITRRASFNVGRRVELHPDGNPGATGWEMADKATVLACRPSIEAPSLDIVTVVWQAKLDSLRGDDLDLPVSAFGVDYVSTRLRYPRAA